jgi:hypothetical protein
MVPAEICINSSPTPCYESGPSNLLDVIAIIIADHIWFPPAEWLPVLLCIRNIFPAGLPRKLAFLRSCGWLLEHYWDKPRPFTVAILFSRRVMQDYGSVGIKVKLSLYRPWRTLGMQEVETPTFSGIRLTDGGKDCQHYAPATIYPQEDSWYWFLLEAESTPGP